MEKIVAIKKYLIPRVIVLSVIIVSLIFFQWESSYSQLPPSPPPVPVPLVPSVLEDIRNTKHNLSSIPPAGIERNVYTQQTTEICIFCHTPHGAVSDEDAAGLNAPLWNRRLSTARYILYDQVWSTSFEAYETKPKPNAPTGYSRLCLSCHDGTIALGTVLNPPGSGVPASWNPYSPGTMPAGSGVTTGDTRVIGTNLQNDHPISFVYDSSLAMRDEELVDPGPPLVHPAKVSDTTPISPLRRYPGADINRYDSVQCTSCHNPHAATYPKFLRTSYYNNDPSDPNYPSASKIICLYCHDKPGWSGSTHDTATFIPPANPNSANLYNYDGSHAVGQYACRACHDPHTAQGAKRLLREGVDFTNNFAIENTCFLCHKPASEMGNPANPPPDVRSEFYKDVNLGKGGTGSAMNLTIYQGHEPVFVSKSQEGVELYSNSPPPFNEYTPGSTIQDTVHIECVDCHNPHQVTYKNRLKGMKGIDINGNVVGAKIPGNSREPYVYEVCLRCHGNSYTNLFVGDRFPDDKVGYTLPQEWCSMCTDAQRTYIFSPRSDPRVASPANGAQFSMKGFSNKRKEFDPNTPDMGLDHTQQIKNPAYHPVAAPGRNGSPQLCNQLAKAFNLDCGAGPGVKVEYEQFNYQKAAQTLSNITIQCTDCHNNDAFENKVLGPITGLYNGASDTRRITDLPAAPSPLYNGVMQQMDSDPSTPQGPHGSRYGRILRANYNTDILNPARCFTFFNPSAGCRVPDGKNPAHWNNFRLCFQCHDERAFNPWLEDPSVGKNNPSWTNFYGFEGSRANASWDTNLHMYHLKYTGAYCHECHYNVHSNVEAERTVYGDGAGGSLPSDSEDGLSDGVRGTHLLNFGPSVSGKSGTKPRWYLDTSSGISRVRCDLSCHNVDMRTCVYKAPQGSPQCAEGCSNMGF